MKQRSSLIVLLASLLSAAPVLAQTTPQTPAATPTPRPSASPTPRASASPAPRPSASPAQPGDKQYDVILDVPNLRVDEISLQVDQLKALLSLDARVANLVVLKAGADVSIDAVKLEIKGVEAEAHLRVSLDNVAKIVVRTLDTLDRNPKLLESVGKTLENVGEGVGKTLDNVTRPDGLLSQTVNTLGQTVQRTVDLTGNIVETVLGDGGQRVSSRNVGKLLELPVQRESRNSAGQLVRQVRDSGGQLIEYTLDTAGKLLDVKVLK